MIVRRLTLTNFRKYRALDLTFPEGLLGVVGRNGMGKTTVIEAIAVALFGVKASRTGTADGLRSERAGADEACSIELEFSAGGDAYRIVRTFTSTTHKAHAYRGSSTEPAASSVNAVRQYSERLLGMDHATFIKSVFARQKEIHALSDATPEERRKTVRRLIGIDRIDAAVKKVRADARLKEAGVASAREAIAVLPERKKKRAGAVKQLATAKSAATAAGKKAAAAKSARAEAKKLFDQKKALSTKHAKLDKKRATAETGMETARKRIVDLKKELEGLTASRARLGKIEPEAKKLPDAQREKESLDKAKGAFEEMKALEKEVAALDKLRARAEADAKKLGHEAASVADLAKQAKAVAAEQADVKTRSRELQKELTKSRKARNKVEALMDDLRQKDAQIEKLGTKGACPTCLRELGADVETIRRGLGAQMADLEEELSEKARAVTESEARATKLEARGEHLEKKAKTLQASTGEAKLAAQKLASLQSDVTRTKQQVEQKRARISELERTPYDAKKHGKVDKRVAALQLVAKEAHKLETEVARITTVGAELRDSEKSLKDNKAAVAAASAEIAKLEFVPKDFDAAQKAYDVAVRKHDEAAKAHAAARERSVALQGELKMLDEEIEHLEGLKKGIADDEQHVANLRQLVPLLEHFRNDLQGRVRPVIAERASMLLDRLTKGKYPQLHLDDDYSIRILDEGELFGVKRFSGGEQDLANLALRVAISQVVSERSAGTGPSFIALDEVFGSQDADRRTSVLEALLSLTSQFRQILLITHVDDIHDRVPHVLRVDEGAEGASEAVWG